MVKLSILCWNVKGLNTKTKRVKCLDFMRRHGVDVACITESHLKIEDVSRMQNKTYKVAASSSAGSKTKGSMIMIRRNLDLVIEKTLTCQNDLGVGRLSLICTSVQGKKIAFVSVYAPSVYDPSFFPWLSAELLAFSDYELIVAGDMNAVLDVKMDRSSQMASVAQQQASNDLKAFLTNLNLFDAWRSRHPDVRDYTFFSASHKTFSRIDHIFLSHCLNTAVDSCSILPMTISDHNPVVMEIDVGLKIRKSPRWRLNTTLLQNESFLTEFQAGLIDFLSINRESVDDPVLVWMATKGFIRNFSLSFSSHLNKVRTQKTNMLEQQCQLLEQQLKSNYSQSVEDSLMAVKVELNDLLRRKAEFLIHRVRQKYYFHGSRPSKLLALKLKHCQKYSSINSIRSSEKGLVFDPKEINNLFKSFYQDLYSSAGTFEMEGCHQFLDNLDIPCLEQTESEELGKPISLEELHVAVKSLTRGKTPGPDGIPPELLLQFWDSLGPVLLEAIQAAVDQGYFHDHMNTALISLLPKKGKDHTECGNYRPISLINSDLKLYSKVLASRLDNYMGKLIHLDQAGFMKGRLAADNVRRLLHVIYQSSHKADSPSAALSLDAEKAFDRIEWEYLWVVMDKFGLGRKFIDMVKVLYRNPSAVVCTNGLHSDSFSVFRGTRQGSPLSPALFLLSIEPLAQYFRQHQIITPVQIKGSRHVISLFADDIILYMSDMEKSLNTLLPVFDKFEAISGYKINWGKSALLPLNSKAQKVVIPSMIPLKSDLVYLGINVSTSLPEIVKFNYEKIFKDVQRDLANWSKISGSLQTRISVIKMNILPRINFISMMLPLPPPTDYWKRLDGVLHKFMWDGKHPKIRFSTLQRSKLHGGLSLPNFKLYHQAFQLRPLKTWLDPSSLTSWRQIEEALTHPSRLQDVLFSTLPRKKYIIEFGPIINYTMKNFRIVEKQAKCDIRAHTHTPLWNNHGLTSGKKSFQCQSWTSRGIHTLGDLYGVNGLMSFQELCQLYDIPKSSFFLYLQLRSALRAYGVPWESNIQIHPIIKKLLISPFRGFVTFSYQWLSEANYSNIQIQTKWERDLAANCLDWDAIWENVFSASKNPNHQLIQFKFCHRAYWTPIDRFHAKQSTSLNCSLCNKGIPGTFKHMVWDCEEVHSFWREVTFILSELLELDIPLQPSLLLLNDDSQIECTEKQRKVCLAGLTAAKKLIVQRWLPPHKLPIKNWLLYFQDIIMMELSTARIHGARVSTIQMWERSARVVADLLASHVQ